LFQANVPMLGARKNDSVLVAIAFAALIASYVRSDFSVLNVFENSHSAKPLIYKITVWGNHEGSMLLWVFILALFGSLVAAFGRNLPVRLKARALGVQAWIVVAAPGLDVPDPRYRDGLVHWAYYTLGWGKRSPSARLSSTARSVPCSATPKPR
jgi:cytochrome c biogenesis factor